MPLKVSVLFADTRAGWSESFYFAESTSLTNKRITDDLCAKRATVLGSGVKIIGARIGKTGEPRFVQNFIKDLDGQAADGDGASSVYRRADSAHTCVLMPYRTSRGTKRYVTVSAFPDTWLERTDPATQHHITEVGKTKLGSYYDFLLSAPWTLLIRERLITAGNAPMTVTDVAEHEDGRFLISSPLAATVVPGDKVTLTNIKGTNLANIHGIRKVAELVGVGKFTIDRGPRSDLGDIIYNLGGFVSKVAYQYSTAVNTEEPYLVTTRKRGRPFGQRRGRRSAVR